MNSKIRQKPLSFRDLSRCAIAMIILGSSVPLEAEPTALDRYVAQPDDHYSYRLVDTIAGEKTTTFVLEMTSQAWLTEKEVDRPVWKHWLTITRPESVDYSTALLLIGGGSNRDPAPDKPNDLVAKIAQATRSVVAELKMVPNQPLVFAGDGRERVEDAIIAYSWDKYLRTGDPKWPAQLPMAKSAVRAMDTITDFCGQPVAGKIPIRSFMTAGGSKRGWTTWLTAIVDDRVVAIAPIVIDMLNVQPSFIHHWEAYGAYSSSVHDYEEMGIMEWQGTPEYDALMRIVEPFEYRDRLTLPKFIINASGDQFFLPDSSQFYFDELPEPKYLRYVPNADHSLDGTDAVETLTAGYDAVLDHRELPHYSWSITSEEAIRVRVDSTPSPWELQDVLLWQATNPEARDFRVETIGKVWTNRSLEPESEGVFLGQVEPPATGWTAFLVELTWTHPESPTPLKLTSGVHVVPTAMPFEYSETNAGSK